MSLEYPGEVLGFENLVFSIFDFVSAMIDAPKFRGTVRKLCDQLLYYVVLYMQITEEQVGHPILPYIGKRKQVTKVKFLVKDQNVSVISTDINRIS